MFKCFKKRRVKVTETVPRVNEYPEHYNVALELVGTREISGSKHNPVIEKMFDLVTGKKYSDETPWCAAFVGYALLKTGHESTGKLTARSYLKYGEKIEAPKTGDIVIFWRGKKDGWQGHVAFFVKDDGKYVVVLGGNQSNKVSFARYKKSKVLGYRRPSINV